MLNGITIKGFRRYKEFKLSGFNEINFILGDNNIGKTSILEAIFTWACGQNVSPLMSIPMARGRYTVFQNQYWLMEELLAMVNERQKLPLTMSFEGEYNGKIEKFIHKIYPSDLLTDYDSSYKNSLDKIIPRTNEQVIAEQQRTINLQLLGAPVTVARWDIIKDKKTVSSRITAPSTVVSNVRPFANAKFIDILSHTAIAESLQMYSSLKREGLMSEVVRKMEAVFPEIKGFDVLPYPDGSQATVSVVKEDGSSLPMYACGDGVQRWFYIIGALTIYRNAILCIDEIDVGLHPNAQIEFCLNVTKYAIKNKVQLFITTHNLEFIDSYLSAVVKDETMSDKINIFTLKEVDGDVHSRNLSAKDAYEVRREYNMELR